MFEGFPEEVEAGLTVWAVCYPCDLVRLPIKKQNFCPRSRHGAAQAESRRTVFGS